MHECSASPADLLRMISTNEGPEKFKVTDEKAWAADKMDLKIADKSLTIIRENDKNNFNSHENTQYVQFISLSIMARVITFVMKHSHIFSL